MNAEWQKIVEGQGMMLTAESAAGSADATAVVCPLSSVVVLSVTGEDAESFLQAQFSNDIAALELPASQLTTWSSPKGRVITLLRVTRISDGYLLQLPAELLEPVLKRLRMYVLMAKVTIEPRNDMLVAGISGENAAVALASHITAQPSLVDDVCELPAGGWITRVRGDANGFANRFEITAEADQMAQYYADFRQSCTPATELTWRLQNIDAGVPSISAATSEAFVLQMLNLQHINGVSFKKGCFPGQEVVARMQYLGKLKRQMYRLQHTGNTLPAAGDEIYIANRDSAVGKVVDAVSVDGNSSRLLAVMAIAETTAPLYLDKDSKLALEVLEIPYETPAPV